MAHLHVQLLALPVDAPHEGQVRGALQQQLLPLLGCQVQHLRGRGDREVATRMLSGSPPFGAVQQCK